MKMSVAILFSFFTLNFSNAQQPDDVSPLALSAGGASEQAKMSLATAQEAFLHLNRNTDSKSLDAKDALKDTIFLTSQLSKKLCE